MLNCVIEQKHHVLVSVYGAGLVVKIVFDKLAEGFAGEELGDQLDAFESELAEGNAPMDGGDSRLHLYSDFFPFLSPRVVLIQDPTHRKLVYVNQPSALEPESGFQVEELRSEGLHFSSFVRLKYVVDQMVRVPKFLFQNVRDPLFRGERFVAQLQPDLVLQLLQSHKLVFKQFHHS
jgi:hypothetical protein